MGQVSEAQDGPEDAAMNTLEQEREKSAVLRAALERIEAMAVRPYCACGAPTGTAAIRACAQQALNTAAKAAQLREQAKG